MVTINLLPWRTHAAQCRAKKQRFFIILVIIGLLVILIFIAIYAWLHVPALPKADQPLADIPAAEKNPHLEDFQNAMQLQKNFSSISYFITATNTIPITLNRLIIQSQKIMLYGTAPSIEIWLSWLEHLQHSRQWNTVIKYTETLPKKNKLAFVISLTPNKLLATTVKTPIFEAINHHTNLLTTVLHFPIHHFTLQKIKWPETDEGLIELRATGTFNAVATFIDHLIQHEFFCPLTKIDLMRSEQTLHFIAQWRWPCFKYHEQFTQIHIPQKDPFRFHPIFSNAPHLFQNIKPFSIVDMRFSGWIDEDNQHYALIHMPNGHSYKILNHSELGKEKAKVTHIYSNGIVLETAQKKYCLTTNGLDKDDSLCAIQK